MDAGLVEAINIGPPEQLPAPVASASAHAGKGLVGNRYYFDDGAKPGQALTLIAAEALEAMAGEQGVEITAAESRRNVLTRGIDLNALVGKRFRVGAVECVGVELCEPCTHLESMTRPGVIKGLAHRGGLNADILTNGEIAVGDEVVATDLMDHPVRVACAQVEPVVFDRDATIDKVASVAAEVAANGAQLVLFPETFVPAYPSARWVHSLATPGDDGKKLWARLARASVTVPSAETERLGSIAREHSLVLSIGVNELDGGTLYNTQLIFTPDGALALTHRKLMPTNHERMIWGIGDGNGLATIDTPVGRVGGLICWENFMPLARAALYESGLDVYLAPTADDSDSWLESIRHIARESRAFVLSCCFFQRASSYPDDVPLTDGPDLLGRGGSAIVGPDGQYLAGPLWDEEGILYAELDPDLLFVERQRFDAAGHYSRPDVLQLHVQPIVRATPKPE